MTIRHKERFDRFLELIETELGLKYPHDRHDELIKQLTFSLKLTENELEEFISQTLQQPSKRKNLERIAEALTIGETYFFRVGCGFEALEKEILPNLIAKKQGKEQSLRIWSTSCCRGDEPYSIAILLDELLGAASGWNITILGTDINRQFLEQARKGIYSSWAFRNLSETRKRRYFKQIEKNQFELSSHIRKKVRFSYLNLAEESYPSLVNGTNAQDIILCNNTLYYFSLPVANQVIRKFARSLVDEGYMIVSTVESTFVEEPKLLRTAHGNIFQKIVKSEPKKPPFLRTQYTKPIHEMGEVLPPHTPSSTPDQLFLEGNYTACIQQIEQKTPSKEESVLLIRSYANIGQLDQAERVCRTVLEADQLQDEAHLLLAAILHEKNQYEEAALELKRALFLNPSNAMAHFLLCYIMRIQGRSKEVALHRREALLILKRSKPTEIVPGSEQMTAGQMQELLENLEL